jgi:hypothetical protein
MFNVAVRTADPGEAGTWVATVEVALDDFPDDWPEIVIFPLEPRFVFDDESLEMMEQHPIEDRPLRMARMIDSRHIGATDSRSVPSLPKGRIGSQARNRSTTGYTQVRRLRKPGQGNPPRK